MFEIIKILSDCVLFTVWLLSVSQNLFFHWMGSVRRIWDLEGVIQGPSAVIQQSTTIFGSFCYRATIISTSFEIIPEHTQKRKNLVYSAMPICTVILFLPLFFSSHCISSALFQPQYSLISQEDSFVLLQCW